MDIQVVAQELLLAEKTKKIIAPLTETYPEIASEDAYRIQLAQMQFKTDDGAVVKGLKIGLTSKAMQDMLNVHTPDYGFILDTMVFDEQEDIPVHQFLQPKVEFEITFIFNKELSGPNVTVQDVIEAKAYVVPTVGKKIARRLFVNC